MSVFSSEPFIVLFELLDPHHAFSKPRAEQKTTLSINNRNMHDTIARLIEGYDTTKRYSVDGHFDPESKVMYYDMKETRECAFHKNEK